MSLPKAYYDRDGIALHCGDCLDVMGAMEANSVDLVFGSPLYCDARTYGIDAQRGCEEWVAWMLDVTTEAARVSRGPVFWVIAGVTRKRNYWPAPEGLMWEWWKRGGDCQLYRPCVFHRVGIPGSGGTDYLRADWEYVACFKGPGELPWSDNTAMGHPPKWAPGGEMSHRLGDGRRVNQWGKSPESPVNARKADGTRDEQNRPSHVVVVNRKHAVNEGKGRIITPRGERKDEEQAYIPPKKANPGNVIACTVGGGHMGHPLAHENEAPFPEALAEFFIRSFCPEGGLVLDPFVGSGTTLDVCRDWGRRAVGIDVRESQCEIVKRRLAQQMLPFGD